MHVLVTGATGFAGLHLVDHLLATTDDHIWATGSSEQSLARLPHHARLQGVVLNVLEAEAVKTAVSTIQPALIYHLAGQAYPGRSWQTAAQTLAINAGGTAHLLDAAVALTPQPRVVVVTSAEIYGRIADEMLPINETTTPQPRHPYGISKLAAGELVRVYAQRHGLAAMEARPFNHIGPRQALGFVVPDFASQLAAIRLGQQTAVISVGNLDAQRDFTDVRDVVRAYAQLGQKGKAGESYLICSGQPISIQYLLTTLAELAQVEVEIVYDPARLRPSDVPCLYGSYAKLKTAVGWQPQIHLRQSLADSLAEWIEHLQARSS